MDCKHDQYHAITSHYDRKRGELVFFSVCEACGRRLSEIYRQAYRPRYQPRDSTATS